jgi:hypothetical protein
MVQPDVFKGYLQRKGDTAKGIGFFARCLICQPDSNKVPENYQPRCFKRTFAGIPSTTDGDS